jgi:hypothetical protein
MQTGPLLENPKTVTRHHYYLLGCLLFVSLHLVIWPLIWHRIILPHVQPNQHQLRVESSSPSRIIDTGLFLDKPESSLTAYAVWQIPRSGYYHIRLSCDDNGQILIDDLPVLTLTGISAFNTGEAKQWLSAGPHFLELRLNNLLLKGWLKMEVAEPGQTVFSPLRSGELSFLELRNTKTWLDMVGGIKIICLFGFLILGFLWTRFYFNRWTRTSIPETEAPPQKLISVLSLNRRDVWRLLVGAFLIYLFVSQGDYYFFKRIPWDFEIYFEAVKTYFAGGNPYNHPIYYHPYFFIFFLPLIGFSLQNAAIIYLGLNIALLFYLLLLLNKIFEGHLKVVLFIFLLVGAFNHALFLTFNAGNLPVIETALLWTAFYYLTKENAPGFTLFIFLVSLLRIFPILLILLVFFLPREKRSHIGKVFLLFIFLWTIPFLFSPSLLPDYITGLLRVPPDRGINNPCSLSLIFDIMKGRGVPYLYGLWIILVLFFFFRSLIKLNWDTDRLTIIFLSLLSFALIVPRFKDYSYVLIVPAAYGLIIKNISLVIPAFWGYFDFIRIKSIFFADYHPFFALMIFWGSLVYQTEKKSKAQRP